jgi:hypothetical protein
MDRAITPFEPVERATVAGTYAQILSDINNAKNHFAAGNPLVGTATTTKFFMNLAAVHALEARVHLYMKSYQQAITSANLAITQSDATLELDSARYVNMWLSSNASREDIFTFSIDGTNQLSANSINTYYNTYGGSVNPASITTYWEEGDMRLGIIGNHTAGGAGNTAMRRPLKFPNIDAVNNVPVFRVPEMYLILAEAYNELATPNITEAQKALFQIAQRNPAIASVDDLPDTQVELRKFIKEERIRELFQEGHRLWDIRRNGDLMTRPHGETKLNIVDHDIAKFCYPIPFSEINVPGSRVVQTPGWNSNIPRP